MQHSSNGISVSTSEVLKAEARWFRGEVDGVVSHQVDEHDPNSLSALCLSGGGIRSATFCLGVLQALAQKDMLGRFHYLSTVSGGGYIGSWLTAWIKREGHDKVMDQLAKPGPAMEPEPKPVHGLRAYSNYLSPVWGVSADSLSLVATFIRNLVLNWLVILPLLAALLILPRVHLAMLSWSEPNPRVTYVMLALAALLLVMTIAYIVADLPGKVLEADPANRFALLCFAPLVVACVLVSWAANWNAAALKGLGAITMAGIGAAIYVVAVGVGMFWRERRKLAPRASSFWDLVFTLASGAVGGWALYGVASFVPPPVDPPLNELMLASARELYATLCVPVLLAVFWAGGTVYAGLSSRIKGEDYREWWARAAAWWLGAGTVWVIAAVLVIYAPRWLMAAPWLQAPSGPETAGVGAALLGILAGAAGYWSKNGAKIKNQATSVIEAMGMKLLDLVSLVFIVALLLTMSIAVSCSLRYDTALGVEVTKAQKKPEWLKQAGWPRPLSAASAAAASAATKTTPPPPVVAASAPVVTRAHVAYSVVLGSPRPGLLLLVAVCLLGFGVLWSWAMGINTFSLHSMYGNRLARAYLGASNGHRRPHWFTGFDEADNPKFANVATAHDGNSPARRRLFHVVNVALNLVKPAGGRIEWQQRMAASFTMSPLHCGSAALGPQGAFVATTGYGDGHGGLSLGRAMAISGAAASPNMGYHTSKLVAFVMTFFNVRLGWWAPNPLPDFSRLWTKREPRLGAESLLKEATAGAAADSGFVYLSDGGHFENLGLYEMVRRGCRRIVVVDASCDVDYKFDDLQDALRKIHIDFGIPINFDEPLPTPAQARASGRHVAVATIRYDFADPQAQKGCLVYIKPVLSGDEPLDITCYAADNKKPGRAFPHQSTADQFFDEAQFESYRALGMHSVENIFQGWEQWPVAASPGVGGAPPAMPPHVPLVMDAETDAVKVVLPLSQPGPVDGLLPAAARGLQSASQQVLLATALTIGGVVGVTGTVGLRDSEVTLKEGAKVSLATTDLKLSANDLEVKLSDTDRKALGDQLARDQAALAAIQKAIENINIQQPERAVTLDAASLEAIRAATASLRNLPNQAQQAAVLAGIQKAIESINIRQPERAATLDPATLEAIRAATASLRNLPNQAQQAAALAGIQKAIESIRTPQPDQTVRLDPATQEALRGATASLRNIEEAVKDTPPRRSIRAVNEGTTR